MKKILVILLTIMLCCSFVFADEATDKEPVIDYTGTGKVDNFAFQPTMSRFNAMGQSGLAVAGRLDAFYTNPAALAGGRLGISAPSVALTLYNVQKVVADKSQRDLVASLLKNGDFENDGPALGEALVKNLGNGYNVLAKVDASVGLALGSFGLGTNVQVKLHTFAKGSSNLTNTTIIPEVNVAQTLALGINILKTNSFKLQAGVSAHFVYKAYLKEIGANSFINDRKFVADASTLLWSTPAMGGFAVPIDAGINFTFVDDAIRLSVTANNLNGTYYMRSYSSFGDLVNTVTQKELVKDAPEGHEAKESSEFRISTPWTLNAGFAFAPNVIFKPTISVDVVDIIGLCEEFKSEKFETSDILLHLNAGVELTLALFNLRAGINRGYASVGAGFALLGVRVEAAYGWQEFGALIGDKPVDSFTIRVNLGYDK